MRTFCRPQGVFSLHRDGCQSARTAVRLLAVGGLRRPTMRLRRASALARPRQRETSIEPKPRHGTWRSTATLSKFRFFIFGSVGDYLVESRGTLRPHYRRSLCPERFLLFQPWLCSAPHLKLPLPTKAARSLEVSGAPSPVLLLAVRSARSSVASGARQSATR